jgi:hypothetical protein
VSLEHFYKEYSVIGTLLSRIQCHWAKIKIYFVCPVENPEIKKKKTAKKEFDSA